MKNNDKKKINTDRLAALNYEQFSQMIAAAAAAMGLPQSAVNAAVANSAAFKAMLSTASDSDLEKIVDSIGNDRAEKILSEL